MLTAALAAATATASPEPRPPAGGCAALLPAAGLSDEAPHHVKPDDLVRLRDIGSDVDFAAAPIFAVSPDHKQIAVPLRQADPTENRYCIGMAIIALDGSAPPRLVDIGGEALRWSFPDLLGRGDFETGVARVTTPQWLGTRAIAYLKKLGPTTQVWLAQADGSKALAMTRASEDVAVFAISADQRSLLYATRTGAAAARSAITAEGRIGYRIDDRFFPVAQIAPYPRAPLSLSYFSLDLASGRVRAASATERAALGPEPGASAQSADRGLSAEAGPDGSDIRLLMRNATGSVIRCPSENCRAPRSYFWLGKEHARAVFLRREGWADEETAVYVWTIATGEVQLLLRSTDRFISCGSSGVIILCGHETSTRPRTLVAIDPETGQQRTLFDPNPEWSRLPIGRIERLRWRLGDTEIFGDLAFPTDFRANERYPLIIVQYNSRGFLRAAPATNIPSTHLPRAAILC